MPTIKYKIFDNRENKQKKDPFHSPSRTSSRFKEVSVYRVRHEGEDEHLPHKLTHLVAHHFEKPYLFQPDVDGKDGETGRVITEMVSTSFWQEGLAHAVDDLVFSRKPIGVDKYFVDEWCQKQTEDTPHLKDCINFNGFNKCSHELVVSFAGSLAKYLIKNFGVDKFRELYVQSKEIYSPEQNVKILESLYGSDIIDNWRKHIKAK